MAVNFLNQGITFRWLNNAGFEFVMPNGKHLLVDPWLDEAQWWPFPLDRIERADYMLLSHIHGDHADSVKSVENKFPKVKIFVGDLSAEKLIDWQDVNIGNLYRMRGGEVFDFNEVRIEAFSSRHTEAPKGDFKSKSMAKSEGKPMGERNSGWMGTLEMLSYLITFQDGTRVLVWGGMPTVEQANRLRGLSPDIAFMHCSSKLDFDLFAELVEAINPKYVIPHHCDGGDDFLKMRAKTMEARGQYYVDHFVKDGLFDSDAYIEAINDAIQKRVPTCSMKMLEHGRWQRFGLAMETLGM